MNLSFLINFFYQNSQGFKLEKRAEIYPYYPRGYCGVDKIGRPIYIEQSAYIDIEKLFETISEEDWWRYFIQGYEVILKKQYMACSLIYQKQIMHTYSITDLQNFSVTMMSSRLYALINKGAQIAGDNYPEQLGGIIICNAPWTFTAVWRIIKGFLDERTRNKISICSGDPLPELLKHVDIE